MTFRHEARSKWRASVSGEPHESEVRFRRADGQYRWLGTADCHREMKMERSSNGMVSCEDRKRVEEALRRNEHLQAEAQRLSHTGSIGWNVSSDEHFWSSETFRIF
jgi:hypothetical protein